MINIILFSQNVILDSLIESLRKKNITENIVFLTPHFLFDNERHKLSSSFNQLEFRCFADFLSDKDMEQCDIEAFTSKDMPLSSYISRVKENKNQVVLNSLKKTYKNFKGYIFSSDLGIDKSVWKKNGFISLYGEYYYKEHPLIKFRNSLKEFLKKNIYISNFYRKIKKILIPSNYYNFKHVYSAYYNNKKYVFIGRMDRIDYRLNIIFSPSDVDKNNLNKGKFESKDFCQYLTTWHEHSECQIPDENCYDVRYIQDGYLPPNYSDYLYDLVPNNVQYYAWDVMGTKLFKNRNLPVSLIPFRKKIFLPNPVFPMEIKNILIVASGSGDWTALKNRSDDDILVDAFSRLAKRYPNIDFVYRCHPSWIHPLNVGVHSIHRVMEYFDWLNLPNLHVSSHIPLQSVKGGFKLTFPRSSLESDLKKADLVFGEHSISMIDAALKGIPFASVNLTNRRNFFCSINEFGFPGCKSIDDISKVIENISSKSFQSDYLSAVDSYNKMTNMEIF